MPRILGVDIPNNKSAYISLTYLYGIGPFLSVQICYELGIDPWTGYLMKVLFLDNIYLCVKFVLLNIGLIVFFGLVQLNILP